MFEGSLLRKLGTLFAYVVSALLLLFLAFLGWNLLVLFVRSFSFVNENLFKLEANTAVPLIVSATTAMFGLGAALYTQVLIRKRAIEEAHREQKVKIYLEFLEHLERLQLSSKPELGGKPIDQNELAKKLVEFRTKAILWASPGVLKAVSLMSKDQSGDPLRMFDIIDDIQREMRRDIGLSNRSLGKDFFVKLSISDPEELDKMRRGGR